ncbi:hypothetical protein HDU92_008457 [Lobulomyces angularis]|nr:hypothetical protein HDU92_008457 [Lobulomyces angularis]
MEAKFCQKSSEKLNSVDDLSLCTNEFRKKDVCSLNISYENEFDINNFISEVYNINVPKGFYLKNVDYPNINDNFNKEEKSIIQFMDIVIENQSAKIDTCESKTDSFVNHLLSRMNFSEYPMMLEIHSICKFFVYNKKITSIYDFSVKKDKMVFLVEEDKHLNNTEVSKAWGEYQIAGELIAAACNNINNLSNINSSHIDTIYAMRVIGLVFTFYKVTFPVSYIISLGDGFPEESVIIYRYPPQITTKFEGFDYSLADDRKIIISILSNIRRYILL